MWKSKFNLNNKRFFKKEIVNNFVNKDVKEMINFKIYILR